MCVRVRVCIERVGHERERGALCFNFLGLFKNICYFFKEKTSPDSLSSFLVRFSSDRLNARGASDSRFFLGLALKGLTGSQEQSLSA